MKTRLGITYGYDWVGRRYWIHTRRFGIGWGKVPRLLWRGQVYQWVRVN